MVNKFNERCQASPDEIKNGIDFGEHLSSHAICHISSSCGGPPKQPRGQQLHSWLVEPAWLWDSQSRMATPLSMEKFGRIDFSLGKWITRVTKPPKPTKQHVTWAVELVRIFFHSLLWPWEPLSWRSLWNCPVGGHDFPPIWVHDFSLPIASSTQPEGYTMPIYYYAYKNTESRLNWNSFNPWRCFYMDVVYTKTNVKTETQAKTSTKRFKDPMYALFLKISGFRDNKNWHLNGRVGHGHDGHGRSGEKDKYKYKDTGNDKYKVLQRPNVCYIFRCASIS